jgi:tRNA/rRNA methyltransferase
MEAHEDVRHPSMNLGQAVAVCLYELVRSAGASDVTAGRGNPTAAAAGEAERLTALLTEVLAETGYTKRHPANCGEDQIRRLVLRMGIARNDVSVWLGILRQVLWRVRGGGEG